MTFWKCLEKLAYHGLGGGTACCTKSWLDGWAQRVTMNGVKSSWRPVSTAPSVSLQVIPR